MWSVVQQTFVPILILTFPYLALRAYVWRQLLQQLGFEIPWRQIAASFAAGEMTKSIPAGVYSQNYILAKLNHLTNFRIGEYAALIAAADMTGHYGVGVLLESCLADRLAFVERTKRLIRNLVETKVAEKIASKAA